MKRTLLPLLLLAAAPAAMGQQAVSEESLEFFGRNCTSCHTIGGGVLTGPDLKGVTERREREWLVRFVRNPKAVVDSGDAVAAELVREARGVVMPTVPGIDAVLAVKLLDLIEVESALEKSRFSGLQISDRPLTEADTRRGRDLFLGLEALAGGAPPCASCHATPDLGWLGGGRLGPDLTTAYSRLEGRKSLAAWLSAPPSAVMQPVFADRPLDGEEVLALVAYLQGAAESGAEEAPARTTSFAVAGIAAAIGFLVLMDLAWKKRFRGVRRALVEGA